MKITSDARQTYADLVALRQQDPTLTELVESELNDLIDSLLANDPQRDTPVIMEIRPGTGGEESELFASQLLRMYLRFAEKQRWQTEIFTIGESEVGGVKSATVAIRGPHAYGDLKWEGGVHRVQRIPKTEKSGRLHTSAVSVVVLPEVDEREVEVRPDDIRVDVFRSGGKGGQGVNTTDSAVRLTHLPTGIVVTCQDERSQLKNKDKAMRVLRARLKQLAEQQVRASVGQQRRLMIGAGDRSDKMRTYNFPQDRLTDHRINRTWHNLERILDGNLDEVTQALRRAEIEDLLEAGG